MNTYQWACLVGLPTIMAAVVIAVVKFLYGRIRAVSTGVQALLREDLVHNYNKYTDRGYCPIYAKESIKRVYAAYHGLGGNDVATELYHKLLAMPEKPKEESA